MKIFTSYFGAVKKLPKDKLIPIAICQGIPKWFVDGKSYQTFAPKWDLIRDWKAGKITQEEYEKRYNAETLGVLNPDHVIAELKALTGDQDCVLLCYEKPGEFCHRHLVGKWLEHAGHGCYELCIVNGSEL